MTGRSLAAALRAAGGPPRAAAISPLGRYLTDPGAVTSRVARVLLEAARHQGPVAGPLLAAALITVLAGRAWLRRRRHAALAADARVITVLAPPLADPAGGRGAVGAPDRAAAPPVGAAVARPAAHRVRVHLGRPGDDDQRVGPRDRAARHDRAGHRGRLARRPRRHRPRRARRSRPGRWRPGGRCGWPAPRSCPSRPITARTRCGPSPPPAAASPPGSTPSSRSSPARSPAPGCAAPAAPPGSCAPASPARLSARLLDALTPGHPGPAGRAAARSDPELAAEVRATVVKSAGPQWDTQIRYATATTAVPPARGRLRDKAAQAQARARLRGLAHGIASATALYAGRNWLARRRLRRPAAADRRPPVPPRRPAVGTGAGRDRPPARRRRRCRAWPGPGPAPSPRPPVIPVPGPDVRPLGVSDTGVPRPVGIAVADARHHLRVIGPTGTGKTTLIAGQILADAAAGRGVVFVDPKGDAVTDLLARLPASVAGKVVLLDPADNAAPPCLNVLQGDGSGTDHDVITDNVTGIFRRIFSQFWGPRTDDIFRAACLTLLQSVPPGSGQVTLADIPALLTGDAYRRRLTATIRDPVLAGFWTWYEQLSDASKAHAIGPLMNKLRAFLLRSFARQRHRRRAVHLHHDRRPRPRRAVPGPAAQGHPRRGNRAARRVVPRRRDLAGRVPPRRHPPARSARTRACTSTSARTSSTCPTRWKTCSPRPAPTGCRSPWPTRTSPSSPPTSPRGSPRTPGPRSSSPPAPKTPAPWNATPCPTWPPTTCPTSAPGRPPPASSPAAPRPPRSPSAPGPCRPPSPAAPG